MVYHDTKYLKRVGSLSHSTFDIDKQGRLVVWLKMGGNASPARMVIVSTILICLLIIALGIVLGLKIYRDDKPSNEHVCGELGSESGPTSSHKESTSTTNSQTTVAPGTSKFVSSSIEGHYRYAAVASDAGPCSHIGTDMMARRGGSAVDAAIATLLCQCVYHFHSCGIGGGFFMTIYNRTTRSSYTIMAREMAPSQANETMFKGRSSVEGGLAIGIPGEIKGYWAAHRMGGKLPWKDLFQPTIKLCRDGMQLGLPVASAIAEKIADAERHPALKNLLFNKQTNQYYKPGEIIRRPKLADTLETIANEGADAFYNGNLTKAIVADIQDAGGIITEDDMTKYTALVKTPLTIKLGKNQTVYSPPPPSSGAVYQFILNILDGYNHSNKSLNSKENEVLIWHRIVEAFKFAYAKRTHLGDGDAENADFKKELENLINNMTSESYAEEIRSKISDFQTFDTYYYGPTFYDKVTTGTSHLSVLAPNGDAVSVTSTINLYFGSKVVGNRTGIIFNNEMDDFSTPNTTNAFNVPASPANFIKPLKRPLSSMCPSIVVDGDGVVDLVVGASGGTKITTSSALVSVLTNSLGLGIKEAIDHRRVHHQLLPAHIDVEKGFPQHIIDGLRQKGHNITMQNSAGCVVQGIVQREEGIISANSDFRKYGYPDGY